jgi:hypothetical protein
MAANFGEIATGAGLGAGSGALAGLSGGPWGAGLGGLIGLLTGALGAYSSPGSIQGRDAKSEQYSNYTPEIQQQLNQQIQQLLSGQGKTPMEEQALRQFKSDILPNINERYAGMGASSSQNAAQENAANQFGKQLHAGRLDELLKLLQAGQQGTNFFDRVPGAADQLIPSLANAGFYGLDKFFQKGKNGEEQPSQQQSNNQYTGPEPLNARDQATQSIFDQLIAHNAGNIVPKQQPINPTDPFAFQAKPTYQLGGPGTRSFKPGTNNLIWLQNYLQSQRPGGPQGGFFGQNTGY